MARLPTYAHAERILAEVARSPVVCVSGATGCGKSTCVPYVILRGNPGARYTH